MRKRLLILMLGIWGLVAPGYSTCMTKQKKTNKLQQLKSSYEGRDIYEIRFGLFINACVFEVAQSRFSSRSNVYTVPTGNRGLLEKRKGSIVVFINNVSFLMELISDMEVFSKRKWNFIGKKWNKEYIKMANELNKTYNAIAEKIQISTAFTIEYKHQVSDAINDLNRIMKEKSFSLVVDSLN